MERAGSEDIGADAERKRLGTPATRADIIERLVKDRFVKREKAIRGTDSQQIDPHGGRSEAEHGASGCGK